jgi:hypothetical protein
MRDKDRDNINVAKKISHKFEKKLYITVLVINFVFPEYGIHRRFPTTKTQKKDHSIFSIKYSF